VAETEAGPSVKGVRLIERGIIVTKKQLILGYSELTKASTKSLWLNFRKVNSFRASPRETKPLLLDIARSRTPSSQKIRPAQIVRTRKWEEVKGALT